MDINNLFHNYKVTEDGSNSEWQNRPLDKTYSFIFMDAIHYKVRDDKR